MPEEKHSHPNPISTANKLRCHDTNPDRAAEEDPFLKAVVERDEEKLSRLASGFNGWATNMSEFVPLEEQKLKHIHYVNVIFHWAGSVLVANSEYTSCFLS